MKCPKCGEEIANDSNYCEFCGVRVRKAKRNKTYVGVLAIIATLVIIVLLAFIWEELAGYSVIYDEEPSDSTLIESTEYTDLGLPSGTLWKNEKEKLLYDYDTAVSVFGEKLPSKEQWEELINNCTWELTGEGYKVTGNNGEFIVLPTSVYSSNGFYWSATPRGSNLARVLYFNSDGDVYLYDEKKQCDISVWLVSNKLCR